MFIKLRVYVQKRIQNNSNVVKRSRFLILFVLSVIKTELFLEYKNDLKHCLREKNEQW